ncbi:MAG: glycosyltransferase family 4 protein [Methylococcaceae bacterium]|nr:glycosyltransferase family 4 protein [Methylococcaceae bacterium]
MKKKICLVVSSPLSVNTLLLHPISKLSQHYDVYLAVNAKPGELFPAIENAVTVLPVPLQRKISPLNDLLALFKLIVLFRKYRFDLVHSVTPKAGLLGMMAAFIAGIKTRIHTFTGQVWVTRRGFAKTLLKSMDKLIALLSAHNLVDGLSQRQFLLDEGVVSQKTSSVLAQGSLFGVDIERFKMDTQTRKRIRDKLQITDAETVFIFVGRLTRDKGVLDLAAAFAGLNNPQTHLLVVGVDEEQMTEQMRALASDCNTRIHMVGFTDKPEDYMTAADVLCLPSYREGFNNVVIQSAAMGIPTVGSKIYGVVDSIAENETGLFFQAGDITGLQAAMEILADDKELRLKLGQQAQDRVKKYFTSDQLSSAWLAFYQERV